MVYILDIFLCDIACVVALHKPYAMQCNATAKPRCIPNTATQSHPNDKYMLKKSQLATNVKDATWKSQLATWKCNMQLGKTTCNLELQLASWKNNMQLGIATISTI